MDDSKKAKKVYTLEEIKFNPENVVMAALACFPVIGLILMFVEKDDLFVRYHATQYAFFLIIPFISIIPILGMLIGSLLGFVSIFLFILGLVKVTKGERFDIPYLSDYALKVMSEIG